jgi:hypothetical protein
VPIAGAAALKLATFRLSRRTPPAVVGFHFGSQTPQSSTGDNPLTKRRRFFASAKLGRSLGFMAGYASACGAGGSSFASTAFSILMRGDKG